MTVAAAVEMIHATPGLGHKLSRSLLILIFDRPKGSKGHLKAIRELTAMLVALAERRAANSEGPSDTLPAASA